jgi:hypothetical protein
MKEELRSPMFSVLLTAMFLWLGISAAFAQRAVILPKAGPDFFVGRGPLPWSPAYDGGAALKAALSHDPTQDIPSAPNATISKLIHQLQSETFIERLVAVRGLAGHRSSASNAVIPLIESWLTQPRFAFVEKDRLVRQNGSTPQLPHTTNADQESIAKRQFKIQNEIVCALVSIGPATVTQLFEFLERENTRIRTAAREEQPRVRDDMLLAIDSSTPKASVEPLAESIKPDEKLRCEIYTRHAALRPFETTSRESNTELVLTCLDIIARIKHDTKNSTSKVQALLKYKDPEIDPPGSLYAPMLSTDEIEFLKERSVAVTLSMPEPHLPSARKCESRIRFAAAFILTGWSGYANPEAVRALARNYNSQTRYTQESLCAIIRSLDLTARKACNEVLLQLSNDSSEDNAARISAKTLLSIF